jgi:hypothetical protein
VFVTVYRCVVYLIGQLCCRFFYRLPLGCLVDRAAMLWICYCVTVFCLVESAAMFFLSLCNGGFFSG